jgi:hypothetical protein
MGSLTGLDVVQERKISAIIEVTYLWSINSSTGLPWVINNIWNITQRIETNMASPLFISSMYQSSYKAWMDNLLEQVLKDRNSETKTLHTR